MNERPASPAAERRGSAWRLAGATLLATAAWTFFLLHSRWLFGGSEPVAHANESLDMRLVELPQPQGRLDPAPNGADTKPQDRAREVAHPAARASPVAPRRVVVGRTSTSDIPRPAPASPRAPETAQQSPPAPETPAPARSPDTEHVRSGGTGASPSAATQSAAGDSNTPASGPARLVAQPLPELPDDLREDAYQFIAVARFAIHTDGSFDVTLIKPTPNPRLNRILMTTLYRWRFVPASEAGHPVESRQDVRVHFNVN